MKTFRKLLIFFVTLLSVSFINACSNEENIVVSSSNINTSDLYIIISLPLEFELDGIIYQAESGGTIPFSEDYELIGYFVNECDLEYWMEYDNNPSLKYVVDENNSLINRLFDEDLFDRFGLYSIDIEGCIGLKCDSFMFYIYKSGGVYDD